MTLKRLVCNVLDEVLLEARFPDLPHKQSLAGMSNEEKVLRLMRRLIERDNPGYPVTDEELEGMIKEYSPGQWADDDMGYFDFTDDGRPFNFSSPWYHRAISGRMHGGGGKKRGLDKISVDYLDKQGNLKTKTVDVFVDDVLQQDDMDASYAQVVDQIADALD